MADEFLIPSVNYTTRDYASIRDDMLRLMRFFAPDYTNLRPSDPGVAILETVASQLETLHFYADKALLNQFIDSAITRASLVSMAKLLDYLVPGPSASAGTLRFTLSAPHPGPGNLVIPAGTRVSTAGDPAIEFITSAILQIAPGDDEGEVAAVQGVEGELFFTSEGAQNQRLLIDVENIIDGSHLVEVDEAAGPVFTGVAWNEVDSLAFSTGADNDFEIERDDINRITVILGDNSNGRIPPAGSILRITYRVGNGEAGNVGEGTITTLIDTISFLGQPVSLEVTNDESFTGGSDGPSLEELRRNIPRSIRTLNRAVTAEDFRTLSESFPGIGAARAFSSFLASEDACGCGVRLVVAAENGGNVAQVVKDDLLNYLNDRKMITTEIEIADGVQVPINVNIDVFYRQGYTQDQISTGVEDAIEAAFEFGTITFGQQIVLSDLYTRVMNVEGVHYITVNSFYREPEVNYVIWNGGAIVQSINVNKNAVNETVTITLTSPSTFSVRGSVSGLQANTGVFGTAYYSDNHSYSFIINNSGSAHPTPSPGVTPDSAKFIVSSKVGDIDIADDEIAIVGTKTITYTQLKNNRVF